MFELKYKITQEDVKSVNLAMLWLYFIPYLAVALVGIGAGIAAAVLRPSTIILVLGVILIVLGSILLGCAVLLAVAPKTFVMSALLPSDDVEREFIYSDENITVRTPEQSDIIINYNEITKLKRKKTYLLAFIGHEMVLIIKDAITSGQTLDELHSFLTGKAASSTPAPAPAADKNKETADTTNAAEEAPQNNEEEPAKAPEEAATQEPDETPDETPAEAPDAKAE